MIPDNVTPQQHAYQARQVLRNHRYGALCTLSKKFGGHPFASITPYLVDHDGSLVIFISDLAEHTRNIRHDARVSLITHNQEDPHIQTQGRVTVVGHACEIADREQAGKRYLRYFPEAQTYFEMQDFSFFRIQPRTVRYIGGFGAIHWVSAENYLLANTPLQEFEDALIAQINTGSPVSTAPIVGIDPEGYDMRVGERLIRHAFANLTDDPDLAVQLIRQAR